MDLLDIDKRVDHAIAKVDDLADRRIKQLSEVFDEKIESVRLLLTGLSLSVNAGQVKKAEPNV